MAVELLVGNDRAYLGWLASNPDGWVVNARPALGRDYLKLHRATCFHISRPDVIPGAWTERSYVKVCSPGLPELERWLQARSGGGPESDCYCLRG